MRSKILFLLAFGIGLFAVSGCSSLQPPTPVATSQPTFQTAAPSATGTVTPMPAAAAPALSITSLQMMDANQGWAWANGRRLLRTSDGGQTWMDRTPERETGFDGEFFLDAQSAWVPIFLQSSNRFGLLRTSDGGLNWSQFPYSPPSRIHFTDGLNGWAEEAIPGAGNVYITLFATQDGGANWKPIPVTPPEAETGLPPGTVHLCNICNDSFYYDPGRMFIVNGDLGSMQPGGSVRMLVSFNLGKTWQAQNLPLPPGNADALVAPERPVFFGDKNGVLPVSLVKWNTDGSYAFQRLAFYATQDGGASWSLRAGVLENYVQYGSIQMVSPQDLFALCGKALCATHDGARTWQALASNLDFSPSDTRTVRLLDFLDAGSGWVSVTENEASSLYQTADGGKTWTKLTPRLVASAPVTIHVDTSLPTPTLILTATPQPTASPKVVFDPAANAYRIRFAPNTTWIEINDTLAAKTTRRYVLSAMKGQMMSVSIPQGGAFSVAVAGADKKALSDARAAHFFWRGALPSTQDFIVTVESQVSTPFTLRVAINPPGQATQRFDFSDKKYLVALSYTDDFAPFQVEPPVEPKGDTLLTLAFIEPSFYSPITNLSEAYLTLTASQDPAIVATCTQPSANRAETVTGQVTINQSAFTRAEFSGVAAGNLYEQISYRTVVNNKCFEVIFLIHSGNIGNYSPGTVVAFDRAALLKKLEWVLGTFVAK